jgi:hypothetical protein
MVKHTNKFRGGDNDLLLDSNYIINNLKDTLNDKPLKYKFDIRVNKKNYEVFIYNEDTSDYNPDEDPCLEIKFKKDINGVSIIVNLINKCAPIRNYGVFILNSLKEFAERFGYYSVIIGLDVSYLGFMFDNKPDIIIELAFLSILSTGESWYNKMGFYNPLNMEQIQDNKYKISLPIGELDDSIKITEFIDDTIKYYKNKLRLKKLPICYQTINSYGTFRQLYNFILDITNKTDNDTIQNVFKELYAFIKNNCDTINKICSVDYDTIQKISCFINFVYEFLDIKYERSLLEYITLNQKAGKKRNNKTRKYYIKKINKNNLHKK